MTSLYAKDHDLFLNDANDVPEIMSSGVRYCIFTLSDVSLDFFDLKNRKAGDAFQKLINYDFPVAFVVPPDHSLGDRVTELAREHVSHRVIRFFETNEDAEQWCV